MTSAAASPEDLVRIDPAVALVDDPDHPGERYAVAFTGAEPRLTAGIWAADEAEHDFDGYPMDEVCVVLEGAITITPLGGVAETFGPGDAFAVRRGAPLRWSQVSGTRKVFVILEDPAGQ